ncbi:MAG: ATP-dependent sacrificial sulfur transferase LarE [Nitrospinota bacterium]|nr:ATP-dependent sacrificial sulfur transferase LarE [Nitrospinota bacterium]
MDKYEKLEEILDGIGDAVIAYSGGVDSTLLLKAAYDRSRENGAKILAITARSSTYPESEFNAAIDIARTIGAPYRVIESGELQIEGFATNPPDRCFYCKGELFGILGKIAEEDGYSVVCDGSNADDNSDYRPGRKAATERGVRSPLMEAGMTKDDIRFHAKRLSLPNWDKPAAACLASRFPYGTSITDEKLKRIEKAEETLKREGFGQVRVRYHEGIARIEVSPVRITELASHPGLKDLVREIKSFGFDFVVLDLEGYRTGSFNELLKR